MPDEDASTRGRRAVVVGAHALPLALAGALSGRGWQVGVIAPPPLPSSPGGPLFVGCELPTAAGVEAALAEAVSHLGGIDVLVHAWVPEVLLRTNPFVEIDDATWLDGCEAAIEGSWRVARAAAPHLRASGRALAVFLIPTMGMAGGPGYSMLATMAEATRILAKSCGQQWGRHGVRVVSVATASEQWIGPDAAEPLLRSTGHPPPALGSTGDIDQDLAPLLAWLAHDDGHFLTSATVVADGGMWMGA